MPHIKTSDQKEMFQLGINDYTCNWGAHICGFFKTKEERDQIIYDYMHAGNGPTDFVLVCLDEEEHEEFKDRIKNFYPDDYVFMQNQRQFQLGKNKDTYYRSGEFSPWEMEDNLQKAYQKALQDGNKNVRGTADMIWAKKAIPGAEMLMAYEARLNMFIKGKRWSSFCLYNLTQFSGDIIIQAMQTHPFIFNEGKLTENQYYIDPETWLKTNAPEFIGPPPHQH